MEPFTFFLPLVQQEEPKGQLYERVRQGSTTRQRIYLQDVLHCVSVVSSVIVPDLNSAAYISNDHAPLNTKYSGKTSFLFCGCQYSKGTGITKYTSSDTDHDCVIANILWRVESTTKPMGNRSKRHQRRTSTTLPSLNFNNVIVTLNITSRGTEHRYEYWIGCKWREIVCTVSEIHAPSSLV